MGLSLISLVLLALFATENVKSQNFSLANVTEMLEANRCYSVPKAEQEKTISRIKLKFQYGPNETDFIEVPLNQSTSILKDPHYDKSKCFVLYTSGWTQKVDYNHAKYIIQYNLEGCNCNFIIVNWYSVTSQSYTTAVGTTPSASKAIARSVDALIDAGAKLCYLSGLSLGGQCSGLIGRNMRNRVRHIIVFDPAGPLFYPPVQCVPPISDKDADCVEVVHTDSGFLGAPLRTGTLDYWVNGGSRLQPNCLTPKHEPRLICSHVRSQTIFLHGLKDPSLFTGRLCSSLLRFSANACSSKSYAQIGRCSNTSVPGNYFLRTGDEAPFGLGRSGATPGIYRPLADEGP